MPRQAIAPRQPRDRRRRQEHRLVEVFDTAGQLDPEWQPLIACVARVSRLTFEKDTRSGLWPSREEIGCYACQIRLDAETLAVRSHWGIENRDHYVRDVGEDDSRIRHRPGGMARIRSAALILAHQEVAGAPGEIPAVPTLITELGVSGVLFTADALHCQKDSFTRAAETDNGLLVQVKQNQPILHETLARLCAEHRPFDSHETVDRRRHGRQEHRLVEVFDTAGQLDTEWQPLIACGSRA